MLLLFEWSGINRRNDISLKRHCQQFFCALNPGYITSVHKSVTSVRYVIDKNREWYMRNSKPTDQLTGLLASCNELEQALKLDALTTQLNAIKTKLHNLAQAANIQTYNQSPESAYAHIATRNVRMINDRLRELKTKYSVPKPAKNPSKQKLMPKKSAGKVGFWATLFSGCGVSKDDIVNAVHATAPRSRRR